MRTAWSALILIMMATAVFAQQAGVADDTLHVSGKAVVFFGPSPAEYVSMSHEEKDAIDHDLYYFYHFRNKVLPFLKLNEIEAISTVRPKILIQFAGNDSITYARSDFDRIVGLIMTDGRHEPRVFPGFATESELRSMFEAYFDL